MDIAPLVGPEWSVSSGDTTEAGRAETTGGLSLDGEGIVPPGERFVHLGCDLRSQQIPTPRVARARTDDEGQAKAAWSSA